MVHIEQFFPPQTRVFLMLIANTIVGLFFFILFAITTLLVMKVVGFSPKSDRFNGIRAITVTALVVLFTAPMFGSVIVHSTSNLLISFATDTLAPMVAKSLEDRVLEPVQELLVEGREQVTEMGTAAVETAGALTDSLREGSGAAMVQNGVDRVRETDLSELAARGSELTGDLVAAGTEHVADALEERAEEAEGSGQTRTERALDFVQRMREE